MKVTIGPYVDRWVSYVHYNYMNKKYDFRWDESNTRYERFLERLEDTLQWIYNHSINLYLDRKQRKVKVKIHHYDTWGMDDTLALIIPPMLKQLKATKQGAPFVDNADVPKELHMNKKELDAFHNDGTGDTKFFARYDWILDEMIWAFEQKNIDWEEQYYGPYIESESSETLGGHFEWVDDEGRRKHQERMSNGFRLFGKYYESLWD